MKLTDKQKQELSKFRKFKLEQLLDNQSQGSTNYKNTEQSNCNSSQENQDSLFNCLSSTSFKKVPNLFSLEQQETLSYQLSSTSLSTNRDTPQTCKSSLDQKYRPLTSRFTNNNGRKEQKYNNSNSNSNIQKALQNVDQNIATTDRLFYKQTYSSQKKQKQNQSIDQEFNYKSPDKIKQQQISKGHIRQKSSNIKKQQNNNQRHRLKTPTRNFIQQNIKNVECHKKLNIQDNQKANEEIEKWREFGQVMLQSYEELNEQFFELVNQNKKLQQVIEEQNVCKKLQFSQQDESKLNESEITVGKLQAQNTQEGDEDLTNNINTNKDQNNELISQLKNYVKKLEQENSDQKQEITDKQKKIEYQIRENQQLAEKIINITSQLDKNTMESNKILQLSENLTSSYSMKSLISPRNLLQLSSQDHNSSIYQSQKSQSQIDTNRSSTQQQQQQQSKTQLLIQQAQQQQLQQSQSMLDKYQYSSRSNRSQQQQMQTFSDSIQEFTNISNQEEYTNQDHMNNSNQIMEQASLKQCQQQQLQNEDLYISFADDK